MLTEAVAEFKPPHASHDSVLHVEKVTQGRTEVTIGHVGVVIAGEEIEGPESGLEQRIGRRGNAFRRC